MLPDQTRQTSCKNCIFAIFDKTTQTGCLHNRIDKFGKDVIEAYDEEKEFFVIKRLCNLHRDVSWNSGVCDLEKAKRESELTFDILINCDNINTEMSEYIINLILHQNKKCKIQLFYAHDSSNEKKEIVKNIFLKSPFTNISVYFNKIEYIYSVISRSLNIYHAIIDETNYKNLEQFIVQINSYINNEMSKAIIFKNNNKIAIMTLACKMFYPNLYLDYENEYQAFENNVKDANLYIEF